MRFFKLYKLESRSRFFHQKTIYIFRSKNYFDYINLCEVRISRITTKTVARKVYEYVKLNTRFVLIRTRQLSMLLIIYIYALLIYIFDKSLEIKLWYRLLSYIFLTLHITSSYIIIIYGIQNTASYTTSLLYNICCAFYFLINCSKTSNFNFLKFLFLNFIKVRIEVKVFYQKTI
jgi:hypothetical protein